MGARKRALFNPPELQSNSDPLIKGVLVGGFFPPFY